MALPDRPVVAIVGDGSSLYAIQALWSAAHYGVGALFVILSNGGYAVMDRLVEQQGGAVPGRASTSTSPASPRLRLPGAHDRRPRRADRDARRGAARPRRSATSRSSSRSTSRPTRVLAVTLRPEPLQVAAARCERAGRVRDPPLSLDPRAQAGRTPRDRAGARGGVRGQPADAARRPAPARRLASDPRLARARRRDLRREHAERGDEPEPQRVDRDHARDRQRVADELLAARLSLEVPLAGLAARNATETTAAELLEAIAEAEGTIRPPTPSASPTRGFIA